MLFRSTRYTLAHRNYFVDGEHYVGFDDYADLRKKLDALLADDVRRVGIAQAGFDLVHAEHRYDQRLEGLL